MVRFFVKLTFISVDEILSFYNSNKTSLIELLNSFIYGFYLLKRNLIFFVNFSLTTIRIKRVSVSFKIACQSCKT